MALVDIVLSYLAHGWQAIRIRRVAGKPVKGPVADGWQKIRFTAADVQSAYSLTDEHPAHFHETDNVGLLLGAPSNGLVDIDIDSPEAEHIAPWLLPETHMIGGRMKRPRTHWWYIIPQKEMRVKKLFTPQHGTFIEFRATGGQTVVPPSLHPEDDTYCWEEFGEPANVDGKDLWKRVHMIAIGCLLARTWPTEGVRHDAALPVGGFLWQLGWPEDDAAQLVYHVAIAAGHAKPTDRRNCIRDSYKHIANGLPTQGGHTMKQLFGEETVNKLAEWSKEVYTPRPRKAIEETLEVISLVDVPEEPTLWLYYPYIPLGYITVLAGDSYQGKSRLTAALVTATTRSSWFLTDKEQESLTVPANTMLLGTEDLPGTVKNRLRNYGADAERVMLALNLTRGNQKRRFTLDTSYLGALKRAILSHEIKLLVIDPLQSFLPQGKDMNSTSHMRELFDLLSELSHDTMCALLIVQHFSKQRDRLPEDRIAGTKDFYNRPRSVLVTAKTSDDFTQTIVDGREVRKFNRSVHALAQLKNSIVGVGQSIEFELIAGDNFRWVEPISLTAHDLLRPVPLGAEKVDDESIQAAKSFLVNFLQGEGKASNKIIMEGKKHNHNKPILNIARQALNIELHSDVDDTYWYLPGKYQAH